MSPAQREFPGRGLAALIRDAGVVGMGGGGFPTHLKLRPDLRAVVVNGAECEPMLSCDAALLRLRMGDVLAGASAVALSGSASEVVLAVKAKNAPSPDVFPPGFPVPIRVLNLEDVYPSGDEFFVIQKAFGEAPPPGAIPADMGYFVGNAATFAAVADALRGVPLTRRLVTVCGAVRGPATLLAPVGAPFQALVDACGGASVGRPAYLEGGVLMGSLARPGAVVKKTTAAVVVLPSDHPAVLERARPLSATWKAAACACCQCVRCTELCSRRLLGHPLEPHRLMLAAGSQGIKLQIIDNKEFIDISSSLREAVPGSASLCSGCGLCSLAACPFDLSPRRLILEMRRARQSSGPQRAARAAGGSAGAVAFPTGRLVQRLGLDIYDLHPPYSPAPIRPDTLRVPMKQHAGVPATPVVKPGQEIREGQLVGAVPTDASGALVHSPADGVVVAANAEMVEIRATGWADPVM